MWKQGEQIAYLALLLFAITLVVLIMWPQTLTLILR